MVRGWSTARLVVMLAIAAAAGAAGASAVVSCSAGSSAPDVTTSGGSGTGGSGGSIVPDAADDTVLFPDGGGGAYGDFPAEPILGPGVDSSVPGLFGASIPGDGPCLSEPTIGAMFPLNWTPPLFQWFGIDEQNVFELRLSVDNQANDLVLYSTAQSWTLPRTIWEGLTAHSAGHDITVELRGAVLQGSSLTSGPTLGTSGDVHLAPVEAAGSVVFWTTSNNSAFKGFDIGAETASLILDPPLMNDGTTCVGCHSSSPDGELVFFSRRPPQPFGVTARLVDGTAGPAPQSALTTYAESLLARANQTLPVLSPAHYSAADAVVITTLSDGSTGDRFELVWTDLHAQSGGTGLIARTGDPREAATPAWSHSGTLIAYTSSDGVADGRTGVQPTDIYLVPYNDRQGGAAAPLVGASEPGFHEYYPVFSPGDGVIAFNRAPDGVDTYDQPLAEIYLVLTEGGGLTRLAGNDPPACTGMPSPGQTNSWARWSPEYTQIGDDRYYWLVFSSARRGHLQLYVSAVVTTMASGEEQIKQTYPAIYVTTQSPNENNHTPDWDVFQVPPPPPT